LLTARTMSRARLIVSLSLLWILSGAVGGSAAIAADQDSVPTSSATASCPEYLAHLRAASNSLHNGDRNAALAELRQAKASLESCIRSSVAEKGAAALDPSSLFS
jgi:hypothetical protein